MHGPRPKLVEGTASSSRISPHRRIVSHCLKRLRPATPAATGACHAAPVTAATSAQSASSTIHVLFFSPFPPFLLSRNAFFAFRRRRTFHRSLSGDPFKQQKEEAATLSVEVSRFSPTLLTAACQTVKTTSIDLALLPSPVTTHSRATSISTTKNFGEMASCSGFPPEESKHDAEGGGADEEMLALVRSFETRLWELDVQVCTRV